MMSLLDITVYFFLTLLIHSPIYLLNEFVERLQVTSDPDTYLAPPEVIRRHGYPAESHYVQTVDGFILETHRIPHGIKKGKGNQFPVLLIHGFIDSSDTWIRNIPEETLAYLLADQGYDVWLFNARGNTYSQNHAKYTPFEKEFWNFDYHEVGIYDLPATIDYILEQTHHEKLFCIAHSSGNTQLYIMLSVLPEYNSKIIAQASLAPYYHTHPPFVISFFNPLANAILRFAAYKTPGGFLTRDILTNSLVQLLTSIQFNGYNLYDVALFIVFGLRFDHIQQKIMPQAYAKFPAGTSVRLIEHLFQLGYGFTYYNYGPAKNLNIYGTINPPEYNISRTRIPVKLYWAPEDPVAADAEEIKILAKSLPNTVGVFKVTDPGFTHIDYLSYRYVKELVYDDVIAFVKQYTTIKNT